MVSSFIVACVLCILGTLGCIVFHVYATNQFNQEMQAIDKAVASINYPVQE